MERDIILKTDRAGRVSTPRERQQQIVAEWKSRRVSAMRFAEAIGVKMEQAGSGKLLLAPEAFAMLTDGIDLRGARMRPWFQRE